MSKDINLTEGTVTEVLNDKVDIDFQNVPSNSVGFARCSTEVTNCITEIPQRIKLELKDGTLTLKADSEVIVPNGFEEDGVTPKFDYVTVESDVHWQVSTSAGTRLGFYNKGGSYLLGCVNTHMHSGNTATMNSTSAVTYGRFYNTETNKIYVGNSNGGSWIEATGASLPICIFTNDATGTVTSLDQVFNGIGYIGSTIWVDKDVMGLIPNGRNEDGSLNNYVVKTDKLRLGVNIGTSSAYPYWYIWSNLSKDNLPVGFRNGAASTTYFQNEKPALNSGVNYAVWYSPSENLVRFTNDAGLTWEKSNYCMIASYTCNNGIVTKFNPKTTFKALDYNDKPEISGWAMPSSKYIDLTLGATGTDYTAPANGWVVISKKTSGANQGVSIGIANSVRNMAISPASGYSTEASIPVRAGQTFYCSYDAGGTLNFFRFVYAEGEV